jgi:FAD/FMN-containing dehydrogenase
MADVRDRAEGFELPGFKGQLLHPGDADYDGARKVFNGMIDHKPALIARCTNAEDVAEAVDLARDQDLPLSLYGIGDEGEGRVEAAFGPEKFAKLQAAKAKWDPTNLFRHNQNIPPASSS